MKLQSRYIDRQRHSTRAAILGCALLAAGMVACGRGTPTPPTATPERAGQAILTPAPSPGPPLAASPTRPHPGTDRPEPDQPAGGLGIERSTGGPGSTPTPSPGSSLPLAPGDPVTLSTVRMIDSANGWGIGGAGNASDLVLKTRDGGNTWSIVKHLEPAPEESEPITRIGFVGEFLDAEHAWLIIDSPERVPGLTSVWRTRDGGLTWETGTQVEIGGIGDFYAPSLRFADSQHGWFLAEITTLGAGVHIDLKLFRSTDSGDTWTSIPFDRYHITGMSFADSQTGWITEERTGPWAEPVQPVAWLTEDGGQTWHSQEFPEPGDNPGLFTRYRFCATYSPRAASPQAITLVVRCFDNPSAPQEEYVYRTLDGGKTWQSSPFPGGTLQFSSRAVGWALGREIYQTSDDGQSWDLVKTVNWDGQFSFVDDQTAWAVARAGENIALVRTTDGGRTWELIETTIAP